MDKGFAELGRFCFVQYTVLTLILFSKSRIFCHCCYENYIFVPSFCTNVITSLRIYVFSFESIRTSNATASSDKSAELTLRDGCSCCNMTIRQCPPYDTHLRKWKRTQYEVLVICDMTPCCWAVQDEQQRRKVGCLTYW